MRWESAFDREKDLGLRVPGKTGKLSKSKIQGYLEALARQYLVRTFSSAVTRVSIGSYTPACIRQQEPFKAGIWRKAFLEVIQRRKFNEIPRNSTKGLATVLMQVKDKRECLHVPVSLEITAAD